MSRPLTLHVSALSDAEFTTYTTSIYDIVEGDRTLAQDYDKLTVGVREARAWLKGRYPTLAPGTLDSILRLFAPDLGAAHALAGGQFFAVLRLVSHVRCGREMDPGLVFVQAHPDQPTSTSRSPSPKHSRVPSPDSNPFKVNGSTNPHPSPAITSVLSARGAPSLPPKPTNPFLNRRGSQDVPPQSAPPGMAVFPTTRSATSVDSKLPPLPPRKPPILPPPRHGSMQAGAQYAQLNRREPPPPVPSMPLFSRSNTSSTSNPLIQQSLQATRIAQSLKKATEALEQERVMEVLKSSADVSRRPRSRSPTKDANSSASSASSVSAPRRTSMHKRVPSLPPRRNLSPPASTVGGSVHSFEQVATASLSPFKRAALPTSASGPPPLSPEPPQRRYATPNQSPSRTPPRPHTDLPQDPPPTHPDRKASALSVDTERSTPSTAHPRVGRSKSLHHPSPPPVPPPLRRKRPESAQLTPTTSPSESPFANPPEAESPTPSNLMLSRHFSFSSAREREREREKEKEKEKEREREREKAFSDSPMGNIQKTLAGLQLRAQPALDAARYKTEGALSRRGFVQHGAHGPRWMMMRGAEGEARLMDDVNGVEDDAERAGPEVDDAESSVEADLEDADDAGVGEDGVEERASRWREGGVDVVVGGREEGRGGKRMVLERNETKWPVGEGWRLL